MLPSQLDALWNNSETKTELALTATVGGLGSIIIAVLFDCLSPSSCPSPRFINDVYSCSFLKSHLLENLGWKTRRHWMIP
ncbi:hypothetical protein M413DRAFT_246152 [Hebeloma cylindrosporum]|uniref:Uncharacterized protein n=1 Tax=Hebeloma cylindrosporum TaxID=76867 RepID=A0A0C3BP30_HEBCY|nr:hypothetical protein M413DRAFT_246152 [Hebeloma cylindrosporum h7]